MLIIKLNVSCIEICSFNTECWYCEKCIPSVQQSMIKRCVPPMQLPGWELVRLQLSECSYHIHVH